MQIFLYGLLTKILYAVYFPPLTGVHLMTLTSGDTNYERLSTYCSLTGANTPKQTKPNQPHCLEL